MKHAKNNFKKSVGTRDRAANTGLLTQ